MAIKSKFPTFNLPIARMKVGSDADQKRLLKLSMKLNKEIDDAYMIIATNIRQKARRSIKRSTKSNPHSLPGKAVKTRTQIYRNTIERDYNPRKKTLIVGPKTRGFNNRKDGAVPAGGQTIPRLLEYGGYIRASRPTFIHKKYADPRAATIAWKKQRAEFRKRKRRIDPRTGKNKTFLKGTDFKWVIIPPGTRKVDPRPTMRLAFNKSISQKGMRKWFLKIGQNISSHGPLQSQLKVISTNVE